MDGNIAAVGIEQAFRNVHNHITGRTPDYDGRCKKDIAKILGFLETKNLRNALTSQQDVGDALASLVLHSGFGSKLRADLGYDMRCLDCGHRSKGVPQQAFRFSAPIAPNRNSKSYESVSEMIENMYRPEEIYKNCEGCGQQNMRTEKREHITTVPDILAIQVNRDLDGSLVKNTTVLQKSKVERLDSVTKTPISGELVGMIVHVSKGNRTNKGHYYAIVKINNEWFKFDDLSRQQYDGKRLRKKDRCALKPMRMNWDQVAAEQAYVLFYRTRNVQPAKPQLNRRPSSERLLSAARKVNTWVCTMCTLLNRSKGTRCAACDKEM